MNNPIDSAFDAFIENSVHDDGEEATIHPPMVVDRDELNEPHYDDIDQNAKDDYEFVRTNLKQIVETNVKALIGLAKVAQESESPRAYEVLSTFMKQMTDANESLIGVHKTIKEITTTQKQEKGAGGGDGNTEYHFHGTTEEFLEMLENQEKVVEGEVIGDD